MGNDDAQFDSIHPRLPAGFRSHGSRPDNDVPEVPEEDLSPKDQSGSLSGTFEFKGATGFTTRLSRSSSDDSEASLCMAEEESLSRSRTEYIPLRSPPTQRKPVVGRLLPHTPRSPKSGQHRGGGHHKPMAEPTLSASGLLNSDLPKHCMHLGVILELLQHLLLAHEVKFTVQLLETLCSSKLSNLRLPMTNEDVAKELQKFVDKQHLLLESDTALGRVEKLIFAKRHRKSEKHHRRGGSEKQQDPGSEAAHSSDATDGKQLLMSRRHSAGDEAVSRRTSVSSNQPHCRQSVGVEMGWAMSGQVYKRTTPSPHVGIVVSDLRSFSEVESVQPFKKESENEARGQESNLVADDASAKRATPDESSQADRREPDGPSTAEEKHWVGQMPGTVSAEAEKSSVHFAARAGGEDGSISPVTSQHEGPELCCEEDGSDTDSELPAREQAKVHPFQRRRTQFLSLDESPVDDRDDLDDLTIGQTNWLGQPSDRFVLHPTMPFRMAWDVLALFFILFECVTLPLAMSFDLALPEVVKSSSTCFFAVDILLNFNTGYYQGALLIMRRRRFIAKYCRTWFVLDLASTMPWEFIASLLEQSPDGEAAGGNEAPILRVVKLGKLMRALRLLRLAKLGALFMRLQTAGLLPASMYELKLTMSVSKMFLVFGFMSHWNACIWGWIGDSENMGLAVLDPHDITRCTMGGPCEPGIEGSPWRRRYGMDNYSSFAQYLAALQYTTALMTGGEVPMAPGSGLERVYTVVMMIVSVFMMSVVVGEILLIMNRHNEKNIAFEELMSQSREFMVAREVPVSLQVRIYRYLQAQHLSALNQQGSRDFMDNLSKWLHVQLVECLHSAHICRHPFFKELSMSASNDDALHRLCLEAKPVMFAAGDPVVEEGHLALGAHFLVCGKLSIDRGDDAPPLYVKPPCWIGDKCLFVDTLRANSVYSVSTSETIYVSKASVQTMLLECPALHELHDKYRQQIVNGDLSALKCTRCGDMGHLEDTCPENTEQTAAGLVRKKSIFSGSRQGSFVRQYMDGIADGLKRRQSVVTSVTAPSERSTG